VERKKEDEKGKLKERLTLGDKEREKRNKPQIGGKQEAR